MNLFSECVTDSGSSAMSATQSFTVAVAALAQPICSSCTYTSGVFRLSISGVVGPDYIIQACTNLADQTWITLRTNNPAALPFLWSDPDAGLYPARFYRIRLGP